MIFKSKLAKDAQKRIATKECPRCKQQTYVTSIYGSICSNTGCFYGDKKQTK